MKLSSKSMIFRSAQFQGELFSEYGFQYPRDLCKFVRSYLFSLIKNTFIALGIGILITGALMDMFILITHFTLAGIADSVLMMLGMVTWCLVFALGLAVAYCWLRERYDTYQARKQQNPSYKQREPGIIATYFQSRREKYCANLEYVD